MNAIKPIGLWIKNFLSYGNNLTYIPLNFQKPTLITGVNLDATVEGQVESNGAGKSTIINALSFTCYDKTIGNKIEKANLINDTNNKNLLVAFSFEKEISGISVFYYIERYRKNKIKGGDGVRILRSDTNDFKFNEDYYKDHDITEDSIAKANIQIENIIGMSFDIFSRIVLYSSSHEPFFSLPVTSSTNSKTSQNDIIEELFNITILSEKADTLKKELSENKKELEKVQELNKVILAERMRTEKQIDDIKRQHEQWIITQQETIKNTQIKISEYSTINFEEERIIFEAIKKAETSVNDNNVKISINKRELVSLETKTNDKIKWQNIHDRDIILLSEKIETLSKFNFIEQNDIFLNIATLTEQLTRINNLVNPLKTNNITINNDLNKLNNEIDHLKGNKCPFCLQDFQEAKIKVSENLIKINELSNILNANNETISKYNDEVININNDIDNKKSKLLFSSIRELSSKEAELTEAKKTLTIKNNEVNPHTIVNEDEKQSLIDLVNDYEAKTKKITQKLIDYKSLLTYKSERELIVAETESKSIKQRYIELENANNPYDATLNTLNNISLPEDKNELINSLTNDIKHQEFLYKLLTKKDSFIRQALLAKNISYLNTRLNHYLNKIRLPHKVQFNLDMNTQISQFGKAISWENLSAGQKARVNIALSFAFRDVLQKRHGKIPLCILDECLDTGLSNVGIEYCIKMIKEISKDDNLSLFVISHRDEINSKFDSKLEIELSNRFSRIARSDIGAIENVE